MDANVVRTIGSAVLVHCGDALADPVHKGLPRLHPDTRNRRKRHGGRKRHKNNSGPPSHRLPPFSDLSQFPSARMFFCRAFMVVAVHFPVNQRLVPRGAADCPSGRRHARWRRSCPVLLSVPARGGSALLSSAPALGLMQEVLMPANAPAAPRSLSPCGLVLRYNDPYKEKVRDA